MKITNIFTSKKIIILGEELKFKRGFYQIDEFEKTINTLIVTAKLIDYEVKGIWAYRKTGFYLRLYDYRDPSKKDILITFYINSFKRINAIQIDYNGTEDSNLFSINKQTEIVKVLNSIIEQI